MFIRRNKHLIDVARVRVAEGRDLDHGLRLDRNERVDVWPAQMLAEIFARQPQWLLSVYPESGSLYRKIAKFHGVEEAQLLVTSGIDGALKTLCEVATAPGDLVGVVAPTYAMYKVYARLFQLRLEEIAYTEDLQFGMRQFDAFLEREPTVFFLPNPNQPVESAFGLAQLEEFARRTLARNCLFVIDEAYHLFGSVSGVSLIEKYENVVIARTFSKAFGVPSIRLGYLISRADNIAMLAKTRLAHESNALGNAVAEHLLDNYQMVEKYLREVCAARDQMKNILAGLGIPAHGTVGSCLLLDLGSQTRARAYVAALRADAIYVKGPWAAPWDRYVTISLGPLEVMTRFVDATRAFCATARVA
jgi:histidinol-phosphate aminotransferase